MKGRTKGALALGVLVALVLGAGGFLATSPRARVRFYAWRMRSADREVAARARLELFKLDRPAIDDVLPELVARELEARVPLHAHSAVIIGVRAKNDSFLPERPLEGPKDDWPRYVSTDDAVSRLLLERTRSRVLLFEDYSLVGFSYFPGVLAIPLDDDLAPAILAAVHDRLGERAASLPPGRR